MQILCLQTFKISLNCFFPLAVSRPLLYSTSKGVFIPFLHCLSYYWTTRLWRGFLHTKSRPYKRGGKQLFYNQPPQPQPQPLPQPQLSSPPQQQQMIRIRTIMKQQLFPPKKLLHIYEFLLLMFTLTYYLIERNLVTILIFIYWFFKIVNYNIYYILHNKRVVIFKNIKIVNEVEHCEQ